MAIKIMLVDDHAMIREGLKQLLELDGEIEVVSEAGDGESCLRQLEVYKPDVLLLDINMPKMNGLDVLHKIREKKISVKTIVLTVHSEVEYLLKAIDIGLNGYMLKDSALEELKKAIVAVYEGETYIQPSMIPFLNSKTTITSSDQELIDSLTRREYDVLKLLSLGMYNRDIGTKLDISERTVKNHISNIFKKLNVNDRTQAAVFAIRNKIVDIYGEEIYKG